MSANEPFLAKFAKCLPKNLTNAGSGEAVNEKGTYITKVERETTDDR